MTSTSSNSKVNVDSSGIDSLDRLTRTVARVLNVPYCGINVVDLQRFCLTSGSSSITEICRRRSLCALVINSEEKVVVVPDAWEEQRFARVPDECENRVRFYAGAPMTGPDGAKVAVFYVYDTKPRPQGLTLDEQQIMSDMSATAVDILIDRQYKLESKSKQAQTLAHTAHDLMTPLTGLQLCVGLLEEDKHLRTKLNEHQQELLSTVTRCTKVMSSICKESIDAMRLDERSPSNFLPATIKEKEGSFGKLADLAQSLHQVMYPVPKHGPMIIEIDASAPQQLTCDGIKVFRAALNLLSTACVRTQKGSVRLRIHSRDGSLFFECQDSAPAISALDQEKVLRSRDARDFEDSTLAEYHFPATLLSSMLDSKYGSRALAGGGSVFWFSVLNRQDTPSRSNDIASIEQQTNLSAPVGVGSGDCCEGKISPKVMLLRKRSADDFGMEQNLLSLLPDKRKKRVMVVDDSIVLRKSLGRSLSKMGYEVKLAENGLEGLRELQLRIYDFCLCDFLMPVMDGLDMVRQLRDWESKERPGYHQYIVGISAHAAENDSQKGIMAGMDGFLSKPITKTCLETLRESEGLARSTSHLCNLGAFRQGSPTEDLKTSVVAADQAIAPSVFMSADTHNELAKRLRLDDSSMSTSSFKTADSNVELAKRLRLDDSSMSTSSFKTADSNVPLDGASAEVPARHCLVISSESEDSPYSTASLLESQDWVCKRVSDTSEAVQLLKVRNWDAVLVGDCLEGCSGVDAVATFRAWENNNRFNRQNNVFLEYASETGDLTSHRVGCIQSLLVQAPLGFDGTLSKPVAWDDFSALVNKTKSEDMNIIIH